VGWSPGRPTAYPDVRNWPVPPLGSSRGARGRRRLAARWRDAALAGRPSGKRRTVRTIATGSAIQDHEPSHRRNEEWSTTPALLAAPVSPFPRAPEMKTTVALCRAPRSQQVRW
jgi:hypothetical protein